MRLSSVPDTKTDVKLVFDKVTWKSQTWKGRKPSSASNVLMNLFLSRPKIHIAKLKISKIKLSNRIKHDK